MWPKTEHPEELALVCEILGEIEKKNGLKENQIKLEFLVESGWAASQLPLLVKASIHRLAGIIWGIADYSADIGLPHIINDHPVCDWVRMTIINLAGGIGVPSIDNMTVNYPVANAALSPADNKKLVLARMKEVYDDAVHGQQLGMDGKWVGHPLQLLCVRLAYRLAFTEEEYKAELSKIEAYTKAVDAQVGATIIDGVMSDRRHRPPRALEAPQGDCAGPRGHGQGPRARAHHEGRGRAARRVSAGRSSEDDGSERRRGRI